MKQQLQIMSETELFNAFSKFVERIRHDVRAPLGDVVGGASLLSTVAVTNEERDRFFGMIKSGASKIDHILSDVVNYGNLTSDQCKLKLVPMRVESIFDEIRRDSQIYFADVYHRMRFKIENVISEFETNADYLKQAIRNIINGANSEKTSSLDVIVKSGLEDNRKILVIDVCHLARDRGQESWNHEGSYYSNFYINYAKLLLERVNGHLSISADMKSGATIYSIRLSGMEKSIDSPALDPARNRSASVDGVDLAAKPLAGLRVLLADDSNDNQLLLKYFLTALGATFDAANDGIQAVDKAFNDDFDVVLMDLQMPRMDGHQATRELRRRGYRRPVIALTAHLGREEIAACAAEGFSDCMERPISRGNLVKHILGQLRPSGT